MSDPEQEKPIKGEIIVEDFLILLSIAALFVLGIFFRGRTWGQVALLFVLAGMVLVFVRRMIRFRRALRGDDDK